MSDAILEEYTVEEKPVRMRLDKSLTEIYPDQTRSFCQKLVKERRNVRVNGKAGDKSRICCRSVG
ncbi:MAG: S4 domain-containing protein [Eubacterium ramulus]